MRRIRHLALLRTGVLVGLLGVVPVGISQRAAQAANISTVRICDESHLRSAIADAGSWGTVSFACSGAIILAAQIAIGTHLTISATGQAVTISGGNRTGIFFVHSWADLSLSHLTIAGGLAANGGGIDSLGALSVDDSVFTGNAATINGSSGGKGGGIFSSGTLRVSTSIFKNNDADGDGGAIFSRGTLSVTNSTFSGNSVARATGGAIQSDGGTLDVTGSTFGGNSAQVSGGAIQDFSGTLRVTDSTFSGNSAQNGGAISGRALSVTNSTFSGNSAAAGGGIIGGNLRVTNSTFSGNSGGSIYTDWGGTAVLANSILANGPSGGNCAGSRVTDGGGNVDDGTSCGFGAASLSNTNPQLQPLANNGGPTQTMALASPTSPAIGAGLAAVCRSTAPTAPVHNLDQRGLPRHADVRGKCDSGAYDSGGNPTRSYSSARISCQTYGTFPGDSCRAHSYAAQVGCCACLGLAPGMRRLSASICFRRAFRLRHRSALLAPSLRPRRAATSAILRSS